MGIIFPDDCKISGVHQSFAAICLQTKFEGEKMQFNSDCMKLILKPVYNSELDASTG